MNLNDLELYVALGDSISIDRYPSLELLAGGSEQAKAARALHERRGPRSPLDLPVGAASLFARNVDALWPEYAGRDLASLAPAADVMNLTMDGAMLPDVVDAQLASVPASGAVALVTLTVGGNDLLMAYGNARSVSTLERASSEIMRDYERCVELIHSRLPNARLVLGTVYDPSDGTGFIPAFHESGPALPLQVLDGFNARIRRIAAGGEGRVLADIHAHFLGHGAQAEAADRWYWAPSMIEPGARGASEVRALWLASAGVAGGSGA
jgi:hypothetical protein